ncbi:hypothetical protein [Aquimarina addita]
MNRIICFLTIIVLISCKSNTTIAQQNESDSISKPPVEKPKFYEVNAPQVDPNTIIFKGIITGKTTQQDVCGKKNLNTIEIKVTNVVASGAGLSSTLTIGNHIFLVHIDKIAKRIKKMTNNSTIQFIAKEKLCQDMSTTSYELIEMK